MDNLTIMPGAGKSGKEENFGHITIYPQDVISIVGPTGSGKTALITDIELLAQGDTATKRCVLVNDKVPDVSMRQDPSIKPIFMISQNTKCFANMTVEAFLNLHIRARCSQYTNLISETIALANTFTGEKIEPCNMVNLLSGGQTRSLLIADAILISTAPIILLDEIENAGIYKKNVINVVRKTNKILVFVTHDPNIILQSKKRIIMKNGAIMKIINQSEIEKEIANHIQIYDDMFTYLCNKLRNGNEVNWDMIDMFEEKRCEERKKRYETSDNSWSTVSRKNNDSKACDSQV